MFLQDHKSLIFTRIGIFSSELMPAYSAVQILSLKLLIYQMLGHCVMPHFEETQSQALFKHKWN